MTVYLAFDRHKWRTPAHCFKALVLATHVTDGLLPSKVGTLGTGFKFWKFERERWRVNANDLATMVKASSDLFRIVGLYYQAHFKEVGCLRRDAVVAALFATFDVATAKSVEFWDSVFTGVGFTETTDPRYALRRYLQSHKQSHAAKPSKRVSSEDVYRVSIAAWNSWRAGDRAIAALRPTDSRKAPQ